MQEMSEKAREDRARAGRSSPASDGFLYVLTWLLITMLMTIGFMGTKIGPESTRYAAYEAIASAARLGTLPKAHVRLRIPIRSDRSGARRVAQSVE